MQTSTEKLQGKSGSTRSLGRSRTIPLHAFSNEIKNCSIEIYLQLSIKDRFAYNNISKVDQQDQQVISGATIFGRPVWVQSIHWFDY